MDGYNMIGAWPDLVALKKQDDLESAKDLLIQRCSEFSEKFENIEVWIVFDAQFVLGVTQSFDEAEVKVILRLKGRRRIVILSVPYQKMNMRLVQVSVATSDLAEQWLISKRSPA